MRPIGITTATARAVKVGDRMFLDLRQKPSGVFPQHQQVVLKEPFPKTDL